MYWCFVYLVGTEALARIREKWGGLLALLEKHGSSFRVDRIPKNDKVTLLPGQLELTAATSLVGAHRIEAGDGTGEAFLSAAQGSSTSSGALNGNSSNSSSATRCLHVGNVPANMTESQLVREFEKFGQLEGLKLVSQRNGTRRFAFVTFQAVDQAVAARHALSKVHPWKSAISFAHKDYGGGAGATTSGPVHNHSVAKPTQSGGHVSVRPTGHSNSNSRAYAGMSEYQASLLYQMQQHSSLNQEGDGTPIMLPHSGGIPFSYGMMPYGASAPLYWMRTPHAQQPVAPFTMQAPFEPQPLVGGHFASGSAAPYAQGKGGVDSSDCPVLQRLCDDTYVPTQPWPSDPTRDQPYCAAVVAQLQQFGGSTTVSKLRGFLRNRISAVDNIKSVPLKAMLVAYPQHFVLDGNYVHLAGGGGGAHTGHHTHALYNTHAV